MCVRVWLSPFSSKSTVSPVITACPPCLAPAPAASLFTPRPSTNCCRQAVVEDKIKSLLGAGGQQPGLFCVSLAAVVCLRAVMSIRPREGGGGGGGCRGGWYLWVGQPVPVPVPPPAVLSSPGCGLPTPPVPPAMQHHACQNGTFSSHWCVCILAAAGHPG